MKIINIFYDDLNLTCI